jgi:D-alanyl-D-alanine carboxypeptidase
VASVRDLMEGAGIPFGNDAANCLGRGIAAATGLSITTVMNNKAAALGMTNSSFNSPHGNDNLGTTTARDMVIAMRAVKQSYPDVYAILKTRQASIVVTGGRSTTLTPSTSNAMYGEGGILANKTGTTLTALKGNLVTEWETPTGESVIACLLDATDATTRFTDMRKVLQTYVAADWIWISGTPRPRNWATEFVSADALRRLRGRAYLGLLRSSDDVHRCQR